MTPSEFYRTIRPDFFSDSEIETAFKLPKEILEYQLEKISTNMKENDFETLARRLAEKRISPNLIPQVGPTGGGDGKTDAETHKISKTISDRWFTPENGWNNDERWAFAISAKADWKSKLRKDIKSIISTGRDYTQIFFITNQKIASKKKRETEDNFTAEFKIKVTILDAEWIIESIYNNDLIDLAVESLNLSSSYGTQEKRIGQNDTARLAKLNELEENISNPNRYAEHDYQLVEDALQTAILSRMLEKPKEEVLGKFERAFRLAGETPNPQQIARLHYQRAWTYLQFYDDLPGFLKDFHAFKILLEKEKPITIIGLYINLFNLLRTVFYTQSLELNHLNIDIQGEEKTLKEHLLAFSNDTSKPTSALISQTHIALLDIVSKLYQKLDITDELFTIKENIKNSHGHIDYPFEQFQETIERMGSILTNTDGYDELIEALAEAAEVRSSELSSGAIFLLRGAQQYLAKNYKESVIYFGKAVLKLAKEESEERFGMALRGLAESYSALDLLWAANSCYVASCSILLKSYYQNGMIHSRTTSAVKKLLGNELFLGRIPTFILWYELFLVLKSVQLANNIEPEEDDDEIEDDLLFDACLLIRLLHTHPENGSQFLPSILEKNTLTLAEAGVLYSLGYEELLLTEEYGIPTKSLEELNSYMTKWANQPFSGQIKYSTNLLTGDLIVFSSKILGCQFKIDFKQDKNLYWAAETLLSFFEGILGTSLSGVIPTTEAITIHLLSTSNDAGLVYTPHNDYGNEIVVEIGERFFDIKNRNDSWQKLIELFAEIIGKNFFFKDAKSQIDNLFVKEEVHNRLGLLLDHRTLSKTILGDSPKFFLDQWITGEKIYPNKRTAPLQYEEQQQSEKPDNKLRNPESIGHSQRKVLSIINNQLWDQAKWQAFGGAYQKHGYFGIFLGFENIEAGRKIFQEWIERFGRYDKENKIRICVVKGVDKHNPSYYRVLVTAKLTKDDFKEGEFIYHATRFHEMVPSTSKILDDIINTNERLNGYQLIPAAVKDNGLSVKPVIELGIFKGKLEIKNAWEVGLHDPERVVIRADDDPIVPETVQNAPVLELLKELRKNNK